MDGDLIRVISICKIEYLVMIPVINCIENIFKNINYNGISLGGISCCDI